MNMDLFFVAQGALEFTMREDTIHHARELYFANQDSVTSPGMRTQKIVDSLEISADAVGGDDTVALADMKGLKTRQNVH